MKWPYNVTHVSGAPLDPSCQRITWPIKEPANIHGATDQQLPQGDILWELLLIPQNPAQVSPLPSVKVPFILQLFSTLPWSVLHRRGHGIEVIWLHTIVPTISRALNAASCGLLIFKDVSSISAYLYSSVNWWSNLLLYEPQGQCLDQ